MSRSQMGAIDSSAFPEPPLIEEHDPFPAIVWKLAPYFIEVIQTPSGFEELRTGPRGRCLTPLVQTLTDQVYNRYIVHALLALYGHFAAVEDWDNRGIHQTRAFACEIVAWRFVTLLSKKESIDYLLGDLPSAVPADSTRQADEEADISTATVGDDVPSLAAESDERTPLMVQPSGEMRTPNTSRRSVNYFAEPTSQSFDDPGCDDDFVASFGGLNALEVAAVTGAKKFLNQRAIQQLVDSIWKGEIVFWEGLGIHSEKRARIHDRKHADPYSRLRVPRYLKAFEVVFFASFLALYYVVLVQKNCETILPAEVLLYIWIVSFAYNEFAEYQDAGKAFYAVDFWSLWDLAVIACGGVFFLLRIIGLLKENGAIIDASFDVLALEALFLVPRACSIFTLNPYFGTLIPCLKEMTKDFVKFLALVLVLYVGFLTTFTLLARGQFTLSEMSWILIKVFFGSSYLGFDVAQQISRYLGPPVMLIFVCMTNILLITSLISLLSNSLSRILDNAKDEYVFVYSVYVLESATSNRLVLFIPPLTIIYTRGRHSACQLSAASHPLHCAGELSPTKVESHRL